MILQALKECYDRKLALGEIARDGWVRGGIDFRLDLDCEGNIVGIDDLRDVEGKKSISRKMELPCIGPQATKHSSSGKDGNLLWDNADFIFGIKKKKSLASMLEALDIWLGDVEDVGVHAVRCFFKKGLDNSRHFDFALNHSEYGELFKAGSVKITFRVSSTPYHTVVDSPAVIEAIDRKFGSSDGTSDSTSVGTCLVSGMQNVPIALTHPVIKGVRGAQTSGAAIVSFNKDAFNSYGKEQSINAAVEKNIATQYVKILNNLTASNSKQCIQIGDATTVFWAKKESFFEKSFSMFFQEARKDDPSFDTNKIREAIESIYTGAYLESESKNEFYILGLSPNAARISIRFWKHGTVKEFAENIRHYFDDFKIIKPPNEVEYYSIWRILVNIAIQDKSDNIPPNLAGEFMRAIINNTPYPATLLHAVLRRIRSDTEDRVKPVRAALLKAYLNRYYRFNNDQKYKEVKEVLDVERNDVGYVLGRLFAVLEKIQEEGNTGINSTIRDRYYGAACATPVTVFTNLMKLKNYHLAKMENPGRVVNFEKMLGEIVSKLETFPAHLSMHEQALFSIGYYHQRQDFFVAKDKKEGANNE